MSEPGKIGWIDLTVPNAEAVRDLYQHVTGWVPSPVGMGGQGRYAIIEDPAGAVTGLSEPSGL
jgi:predicted enzyme related to lactoylglutathione lyase